VLVDYTWYGDANLDGKVNTIDFNNLAGNFGGSSKVWFNGDFNYDGTINSADFNLFVGSYGRTSAPAAPLPAPGLGAVVPEPTFFALAGFSMMLGVRRHRHAHTERTSRKSTRYTTTMTISIVKSIESPNRLTRSMP